MKKKLILFCTFFVIQNNIMFPESFSKILFLSFLFEKTQHRGSLTIYTGSMCSGKSQALIEAIKRYHLSRRKILVVKPAIDTRVLSNKDQRDPSTYISSRTERTADCTPVKTCQELEALVEKLNPTCIAIDEIHFFTPEKEEFIVLIQKFINSGKTVLLAGLDLNFRGEPFGPMPELLALASTVQKFTAICSVCGADTFCISQRIVNGRPAHYDDPLFMIGAEELYEPRCRKCHQCKKPKNTTLHMPTESRKAS